MVAMVGTMLAFVLANALFVRDVFHPRRVGGVAVASVLLKSENVSFHADDGVRLDGNFLRGHLGAPAIVFCHDRGTERTSVLPVALLHNRLGYSVLAFDFRGCGESGGNRSTLGVRERRDVLAAVAYLKGRADVAPDRIGAWGIGMGAYAAFVAAPEAPELRALAVNFIYSDPRDLMRARFRKIFHAPMGILARPYLALLDRIAGEDVGRRLPAQLVEQLGDRQVLFVVSEEEEVGREFVVKELYPKLDSLQRSLIKVRKKMVPTEGSDREGFELNTVQFFKTALPLKP